MIVTVASASVVMSKKNHKLSLLLSKLDLPNLVKAFSMSSSKSAPVLDVPVNLSAMLLIGEGIRGCGVNSSNPHPPQ